MPSTLNPGEEAQLLQTIEMFEVITQSQPSDYQSLEILKEAYLKLGRDKEAIGTSKRIAQAYVQLGQLSSAILEYETILQRRPDDLDALRAMASIEDKANSLASAMPISQESDSAKPSSATAKKIPGKPVTMLEVDDGRQTMFKLFVDGKLITGGDFEACWPAPSLTDAPGKTVEPFIHLLAERQIVTAERSLKLISDKARLGYLPLEKYDVDMELARSFPRDICQRWCVLPFDRMSKSVLVATTNPFNKQAAAELEKATKSRLLWYLAAPSDLLKMIRKVFR